MACARQSRPDNLCGARYGALRGAATHWIYGHTLTRVLAVCQRGQGVIALALMLALCASGCSLTGGSGYVEPEQLPHYSLELYPVEEPVVKADGYSLLLRFVLRSPAPFPYCNLVQEIQQTTRYENIDGSADERRITLVETFRLNLRDEREEGWWIYDLEPYQRDKHFESGFSNTTPAVRAISVRRDVRLYAAAVEGCDFTFLGFAHLPRNREGEIRTEIPENFNRAYQTQHATRGRIVVDDRAGRSRCYAISYRWRRMGGESVQVSFEFDPDCSRVADQLAITMLSEPPASASAAGGG